MEKALNLVKILWTLFREGIILESYKNGRLGYHQIDIFKMITYSKDEPATCWTSSVRYQEFSNKK